MTPQQEAAFERKAEAHFKGQRELPNGRDFRWNKSHEQIAQDDVSFRKNFDRIFPRAPGAGI